MQPRSWTRTGKLIVDMVIQSAGIKFGEVYIPAFTVDRGDVVIIRLPNGPYFQEILFELTDILTGKEKNDAVELKEKFRFVEHIKQSRWKTFLFPLTVKRYIKKYGNPHNEIASKIYELEGVKPNTKISWLAGNPRKLLSLLVTFSWTDKIVFDLAGLDPVGGQSAYDLVRSQVGKSGAAVLIDWCDDFKNDCSKFVEYELVSSPQATRVSK